MNKLKGKKFQYKKNRHSQAHSFSLQVFSSKGSGFFRSRTYLYIYKCHQADDIGIFRSVW